MDIAGAVVPPHIAMANRFFMAVLGGLVLFSSCLAPWHGTQLVNRSGHALAEIVKSVKNMGQMVAQIAIASAEQSSGVDQVNAAMAQIDRVTQTNSAQTEKLAETSQSLSRQSAGLMVVVKKFSSSGDSEQTRSAEAECLTIRT